MYDPALPKGLGMESEKKIDGSEVCSTWAQPSCKLVGLKKKGGHSWGALLLIGGKGMDLFNPTHLPPLSEYAHT